MRTRRLVLTVVAGILALACAYVGVASAFVPGALPSSWTEADEAADRNAAAILVARKVVLASVAYDYRTIDEDLAKLKKLAAGEFKEEYDQFSVQLAATARNQRSVATGEVLEVGLSKASDTSAVVLVAANKTQTDGVENEEGKKTTEVKFQFLFEVTVSRVKGEWLASKLRLVQTA